jgi:ABC-type glycerol-3-phosphate transport system substrate-binding protein
MMKNLLAAFALVGTLGLAACGGADDDTILIENPTIEQTGPAPVVTEPLPPMTTDTFMVTDTVVQDTVVAP